MQNDFTLNKMLKSTLSHNSIDVAEMCDNDSDLKEYIECIKELNQEMFKIYFLKACELISKRKVQTNGKQ